MTTNPTTISATGSVGEALKQVESPDFSTYPVVDEGGGFLGLVTKSRLRRTAAIEGGASRNVSAIVEHASHVQPEYTLVRAVVRMEKSGRRQLAVVDRKAGNKLIGLLTMSDIVRAHAHAALAVGDPDRTVSPGLIEGTDAFEEK